MKIVAAKKLLRANDQLASENRARFEASGTVVLNLVGSPGCGKTTLLESLFPRLPKDIRPAVIEGDIAGDVDAERLGRTGIPVVQINTEGACHLDANMIAAAMKEFDLSEIELLVVENVGNLVCTAGFDLGEQLRAVVLSVAEGDDKLVKYPAIFQGSQALIVSKTDLLSLSDFDLDRVETDMRRLSPEAEIFAFSAKNGDGIDTMTNWLVSHVREFRKR